MSRKNVYFKEAIEIQVQALVDAEIQKGASHGEINFSSKVNDLVQKGLWVEQHQSDGNKFDRRAFDIDLIRKSAGTREAVPQILAMVTEMYARSIGIDTDAEITKMFREYEASIAKAEDNAERQHFSE